MIEIHATTLDGLTQVTVTGHERAEGQEGQGGRVCAAVSAITRTAILGLQALAEEYPDLASITVIDRE